MNNLCWEMPLEFEKKKSLYLNVSTKLMFKKK